jgi:hypothetical protein
METDNMTKTYLYSLELTPDQKGLLMSIINRFGTGQHPVCNECTFGYFTISYIIEILFSDAFNKAKDNLNETGKNVLYEIEAILKQV